MALTCIAAIHHPIAAPVSFRAHEAWRWELPQAEAHSLLDNHLGRLVAVSIASTGTIVMVLNPDGTVFASKVLTDFTARTATINNSGEIALSYKYGRYGSLVSSLVLGPSLDTTNWSGNSMAGVVYGSGLSASVLDDQQHIFHVGSLTPRSGTGGYAVYLIGQSSDMPAWFHVGYVAWGYWSTAVGVSLLQGGDVLSVWNSADTWRNGFEDSYHIARYTADGTVRWSLERPQGHPYDLWLRAFSLDHHDNVVVAGGYNDAGSCCNEERSVFYAAKISDSGYILWERKGPTPTGRVTAMAVAVSPDDSIYVGTPSELIKYSSDGRELWILCGMASSVATDSRGNVYFAGATSTAHGDSDITLKKVDAGGHLLWTTQFGSGGNANDTLVRLLARDDGVYLMVNSKTNGVSTTVVIKYDELFEPSTQRFVDEATESTSQTQFVSMQNAELLGQEFVSDLPALDFVEMTVSGGGAVGFQVKLHESTINGPVVTISAPAFHTAGLTERLLFTFTNTVTLNSGVYVLEIVRIDPPTIETDAVSVAITGSAYARGRMILSGMPVSDADLDFATGVFIPEILHDSEVEAVENEPTCITCNATFSNEYLADFSSMRITMSFNESARTNDQFSIRSAGDGGWIAANGREIAHARGGVNGAMLVVEFAPGATAADVEDVLRNIQYVTTSDNASTTPRAVAITVEVPSVGAAYANTFVRISPRNDGPTATPRVANAVQLWGGPNVILWTGRSGPVVCDASATQDPDSTNFSYSWTIGTNALANVNGVIVTNILGVGNYAGYIQVSDGLLYSYSNFGFRVVRATTVIQEIIHDFRGQLPPRVRHHLVHPLQRAIAALRQQNLSLARSQLMLFRERLSVQLDNPHYYLWNTLNATDTLLDEAIWPE